MPYHSPIALIIHRIKAPRISCEQWYITESHTYESVYSLHQTTRVPLLGAHPTQIPLFAPPFRPGKGETKDLLSRNQLFHLFRDFRGSLDFAALFRGFCRLGGLLH